MDIEFLVNDTFSLVRPQWQLVTSLEEASQRFAEAVAQHYQAQEADKNIEMEDGQAESSSDDDLDEDEARLPDLEVHTSSEDNEVGPIAWRAGRPGLLLTDTTSRSLLMSKRSNRSPTKKTSS